MAVDISNLHDNYKILKPGAFSSTEYPLLKSYSLKTRIIKDYFGESYLDSYGAREVANLIHSTSSHMAMKMLQIFEDGHEHHYREIVEKLFPEKGYGHDLDCFRSLENRKMIKFSSKHSHGMKFYRITDFGREMLKVVKANQVYFRVARWFKIKGEDICTAMMKADLNGEESWKDLLPETLITLLESLFNPASEIRLLGSAYRWMNNFMYLLKTNDEFYEKIDNPDVLAWLQANKAKYSSIETFLNKFSRMQKKRAKAA